MFILIFFMHLSFEEEKKKPNFSANAALTSHTYNNTEH